MPLIKSLKFQYNKILTNLFNIKIHKQNNLKIGQEVYIDRRSSFYVKELKIGDFTRINGPIKVGGEEKVVIGKYCAFGIDIRIISSNHLTKYANVQLQVQKKYGFKLINTTKGPIYVDNNVWIGDNATLLPGTIIGDGAVIGACSVVNKKIPPFSIAVGVPAKVIKMRFDDKIIKELLKIKWWEWDSDKIKRNRRFFEADLTKITLQTLNVLINE